MGLLLQLPPGRIAMLAAVVLAVLIAVWATRRVRVRSVLASRLTYTLLPTTSFDPNLEEILRFAHQLGRVRPAASRLTPRRASALRIRISTDAAGRLLYQLQGPARAGSLLRHQGYPQVELRRPAHGPPTAGDSGRPGGGSSGNGRPASAALGQQPADRQRPAGGESPPDGRSAGVPAGAPPAPDGTGGPVPAARPARPDLHVARAELTLAADDRLPLRAVPLKPDPLQSIAAAVADIRRDLGERAEICLDLLPLTPARVAHLRRRRHGGGGAGGVGWQGQLRAALWGPAAHRPSATASAETWAGRGGVRSALWGSPPAGTGTGGRRSLPGQDAAAGKLATTDPVFAVQLLLRVESQIPGRPEAHLHQLLAAFDQWAGENRWRVTGRNLGPVHLGADAVWRRRCFDRRSNRGDFSPHREVLVTATEIAGLLKPPTRHCALANVVRSGGLVPPAPKDLPTWVAGRTDVAPLGWVPTPDGGERMAGAHLADTLFSFRIGKAGYGKTEQALVQAIALAHTGHGLWFLDPHGDGWQRARPYLAHERLFDRIWEIDLTTRALTATQAGWNPLSMEGRRWEDIQDVVGTVVTGVASALSWGDTANRAQTILTKACETLCELALRLPAETAPTLFQIRTLLTNEEWREQVIPHLSKELTAYWKHTFGRYSADAVPVVTNIIDRLSSSTSIKAFLGQPRSTYDMRRAMDTGRVVFLCPAGASTTDKIVSCLLIYDLFRAGMSRRDLPVHARRPYHAFVDEVTSVDGAAKGTLAAIVEQLRKYGVRGHFMTQMAQRLTTTTKDALLQNASILSTTAGEIDAVKIAARQWGKKVDPDTLVALDRYQHVMSVTLHGQTTGPFKVRGAEVTELFAHLHHPDALPDLERAVDTNLARRRVRDVLADLDDLDEVILDELTRRAVAAPSGAGPTPGRPGGRASGHAVDLTTGPDPAHPAHPAADPDPDGTRPEGGTVIPLSRPRTTLE